MCKYWKQYYLSIFCMQTVIQLNECSECVPPELLRIWYLYQSSPFYSQKENNCDVQVLVMPGRCHGSVLGASCHLKCSKCLASGYLVRCLGLLWGVSWAWKFRQTQPIA